MTTIHEDHQGAVDGVPETMRISRTESWSAEARQLGLLSAAATFGLSLLYVPVVGAAFVAQRSVADPIRDPFLAVLEILILLMAPAMMAMMVSVHAYSSRGTKTYSMMALCFMVLMAALTSSVHFVLLTVDRQGDLKDLPGYSNLFSWEWPSVIYALDILAWDWFLGLSLLFAVPVFPGKGRIESYLRRGLVVAGVMCIAGLVGPLLGNIDLRLIGELGYWFVVPIVSLLLAITFARSRAFGMPS